MLNGVTQNYNIGAIFRLCDAFLVQELVVCGAKVELHKRKLVQAAQGTQRWVPWSERPHVRAVVADAKARGAWVVVAEQTTASIRPERVVPVFPAALVLGEVRGLAGSNISGQCCCRHPHARNGEFAQRRDCDRYPTLLAHRPL